MAEVRQLRYMVVIEHAGANYSAYVPDLPGCVSTGQTVEQTLDNIREAIAFHIEGLREDGQAIPPPRTTAGEVEVEVAA